MAVPRFNATARHQANQDAHAEIKKAWAKPAFVKASAGKPATILLLGLGAVMLRKRK